MDLKRLAVSIHSCKCNANHTDGCSWGWEGGDNLETAHWDAWTHQRYLEYARQLVDETELSPEVIIKVIDGMENMF